MQLTRRSFVRLAAGAAAFAGPPRSLDAAALPHPPGGRLGLELYSLRNELRKDLAGTLKMARAWGFEHVEVAGLPRMSADETARALQAADLRAASAFVEFERLRDQFDAVVRDAHTLGLEYVICGWIPHDKTLTRADVDRAIGSFNTWGAAAAREGLRLGYHIHGYEFVASPDGTLMDTLFKGTDPERVSYEMDVFWVVRGGGDPVALLERYGRQIRLAHLKDLRRGAPTGIPTGQAPDEESVALGTGMIDWGAVLPSAVKAGVKWYFIEDEHPDAVSQVPQTLDFLRRLKF